MARKIKKNIALDNLAGMVERGLDGADKRVDGIEKRFDENTREHRAIMSRLEGLESGIEEIKLKLDRAAYRFEVEEIGRRLKRIEVKLGIK